jgi:hypothetical protein
MNFGQKMKEILMMRGRTHMDTIDTHLNYITWMKLQMDENDLSHLYSFIRVKLIYQLPSP